MARPAAKPEDVFSKGVIAGLGLARAALGELSKGPGGARATLKDARLAIEVAITSERNERGFEPEALELLAQLEALRLQTKAVLTPPPVEEEEAEEEEAEPDPEPAKPPPAKRVALPTKPAPAPAKKPSAPPPELAAAVAPEPEQSDDEDPEWSND